MLRDTKLVIIRMEMFFFLRRESFLRGNKFLRNRSHKVIKFSTTKGYDKFQFDYAVDNAPLSHIRVSMEVLIHLD